MATTTTNYGKAQELLNKGYGSDVQLNYSADKVVNQNNALLDQYKQDSTSRFDAYKQAGTSSLASLKQQTQMQIQNLQNQLNANKQKYQIYENEQTSTINKQYKEQQDAIDQQAFNQYKMANHMGAQRGVSDSAQQRALDNHVGQTTASLFNQNSQTRNDSLNALKNKILTAMVDLDSQYSSDLTNLHVNAMNKGSEIEMAMAGKELEYATNMADKIMEQQLQNNQLVFETEKEKEQYRAQLAKSLYEMKFSNLQQVDSRDFQASEAQKQRDFQAQQNALDRALQQALSASRASSSGSSSKSTTSDEQLMINELMEYYIGQGMNPYDALEKAQQYVKAGGQKGIDKAKTVINSSLSNPLANFYNAMGKTPTSSSSNTKSTALNTSLRDWVKNAISTTPYQQLKNTTMKNAIQKKVTK